MTTATFMIISNNGCYSVPLGNLYKQVIHGRCLIIYHSYLVDCTSSIIRRKQKNGQDFEKVVLYSSKTHPTKTLHYINFSDIPNWSWALIMAIVEVLWSWEKFKIDNVKTNISNGRGIVIKMNVIKYRDNNFIYISPIVCRIN